MTADTLSILIVTSFGLFVGTGIGLILGYLSKKQKTDLREMSRREILINFILVAACSVACIAGLAWYAFR
jgi:ABC-type dipeptide/oligopeptide/nickel transport system permease subunit